MNDIFLGWQERQHQGHTGIVIASDKKPAASWWVGVPRDQWAQMVEDQTDRWLVPPSGKFLTYDMLAEKRTKTQRSAFMWSE